RAHKRFQTAREMALALEAAVSRAPVSAVGAFVDERAGAELAERSILLRAIESAPEEKDDAPPPVPEAPPQPKRRPRLFWLLGAAVVAFVAALLGLRARSAAERSTSEPSLALSAPHDDEDLPPAAPETSALAPATASASPATRGV